MVTCWYCNSEVPDGSQYCHSCGHSQTDRSSSPLFGVVDPVTGIWNSKFINALIGQEANRAIRYHRPLSVLVVELDHEHRQRTVVADRPICLLADQRVDELRVPDPGNRVDDAEKGARRSIGLAVPAAVAVLRPVGHLGVAIPARDHSRSLYELKPGCSWTAPWAPTPHFGSESGRGGSARAL